MIYTTLFHYFASGPFMKPYIYDVDSCEDTWYINLLYLNNFFNSKGYVRKGRFVSFLSCLWLNVSVHGVVLVPVRRLATVLHCTDIYLRLVAVIIFFNKSLPDAV